MRVTTLAVWKSMNDFIAGKPADLERSFDYSGPIAKLDRAAQAQAENAETTANNESAQQYSQAQAEQAQLSPFFNQEMHAQHGFTPEQTQELLTSQESGLGSAAGDVNEQAKLQSGRTRNASGFTKALDEAARSRDKVAAQGSEGVAAEDVMGAKQENQEGSQGLTNLFGENLGDSAKEQQLQDADINTEIQAGQSGWLQNLTGVMKGLQGAGTSAFAL